MPTTDKLIRDEYQVIEIGPSGGEISPLSSGYFVVQNEREAVSVRDAVLRYVEQVRAAATGSGCTYEVRRTQVWAVERTSTRKALTEQRKTGYYVTMKDSSLYSDEDGHTWFSKSIAAELARTVGAWHEVGNRNTVKNVVIGYEDV
jgi:hypothetical protein